MRPAATALASRSLRVASGARANEKVLIQQYSQSTENSSPVDGASQDQISPAPAGSSDSQASVEPKKSRTGGDMSDEGQVHTPNLGKMRTTRDMIQSKGKETEERLASEQKQS